MHYIVSIHNYKTTDMNHLKKPATSPRVGSVIYIPGLLRVQCGIPLDIKYQQDKDTKQPKRKTYGPQPPGAYCKLVVNEKASSLLALKTKNGTGLNWLSMSAFTCI